MQLIGLTGGVASGKSTASTYFKRKGIPVIDADRLSQEALEPRSPTYKKVCRRFPSALNPEGTLDRARLARLVFSDKTARRALESIVHPVVLEKIVKAIMWLWISGNDRVVLDIPLLFETRMDRWMTFSVLVAASPETQLERLKVREQWSLEHIQARIASQMPVDEKISRADIVIWNDEDDLDAFYEKLESVVVQGRRPNFFLHRICLYLFPLSTVLAVMLLVGRIIISFV